MEKLKTRGGFKDSESHFSAITRLIRPMPSSNGGMVSKYRGAMEVLISFR